MYSVYYSPGFSSPIGRFTLIGPWSRVNVVNVGEGYKRVTFITYPHERKGAVNVVNVARRFLHRGARCLPNQRRHSAHSSGRGLVYEPNDHADKSPLDEVAYGELKREFGTNVEEHEIWTNKRADHQGCDQQTETSSLDHA